MDAYIDREFQQFPHPSSRRRPRDLFGRMVVISLVLHAISSIILLSPQRRGAEIPAVSYLDLKDFTAPAPAAPAPKALPEPLAPAPDDSQDVQKNTEPLPTTPQSEMEKLQSGVDKSLTDAGKNPESLQERSFGLGLTNGYFSSLGQGETLRGDIREYYFTMLREINEKWWLKKESRQGGFRGALINVVIARNGTIVDKMLVRSSGNRSFDEAMLRTLDAASPLPPLPQSFEMDYFTAPLKFTGPLNLFTS